MKDEADRAAAAFINRETDGDVSSSAAGSRGKKTWLAARCSVSMTSNMLIQSFPFIRSTYSVTTSTLTLSWGEQSRNSHTDLSQGVTFGSGAAKTRRVLGGITLEIFLEGVASHVCAHEPGTPCAWFIQQWRAQQGQDWSHPPRGHSLYPHHKHTWTTAHYEF